MNQTASRWMTYTSFNSARDRERWVRSAHYESGFRLRPILWEKPLQYDVSVFVSNKWGLYGVRYRQAELGALIAHCDDWTVLVDWLIEHAETDLQKEVAKWLESNMPRSDCGSTSGSTTGSPPSPSESTWPSSTS